MTSSRDTMAHLFSCFDTMYLVLGEGAPTLTNDAYVIRTYEMARAFGEVALRFREHLVDVETEPLAPLEDVLRRAISLDTTGAMVLFAMATVIGPRVLVSLRDARETGDLDEPEFGIAVLASQVLIQEIRAVGEVAGQQAPIDDPKWQSDAQSLSADLDMGGNAESFGISR